MLKFRRPRQSKSPRQISNSCYKMFTGNKYRYKQKLKISTADAKAIVQPEPEPEPGDTDRLACLARFL